VLPIFQMGIERGQFEADQKLSNGSVMKIEKVRVGQTFARRLAALVTLGVLCVIVDDRL